MSLVASPAADPVAAEPGYSQPGDDTQWYHCASDLGELNIGVVIGKAALATLGGPAQLLRQAALLSEVELTLQALEIWQGVELDLRPLAQIGSATAPNSRSIEMLIQHKSMADYPAVRVQLPISALSRLQPVNAELTQSLLISWLPLNAHLLLDTFSVSAAECQKLGIGAVVLLPASFHQPWLAKLILADCSEVQIKGVCRFDPPQFNVTGIASEDKKAPFIDTHQMGQTSLSIRFQQMISITPELLIGQSSDSTIALKVSQNPLMADLLASNKPCGSGAIAPLGEGFALYLQSMDEQAIAE